MSDFVRKDVEFPDEIIESFASVWETIQSKEDAAMELSDDLLQDERIFGGLTDRRKKPMISHGIQSPHRMSVGRCNFSLMRSTKSVRATARNNESMLTVKLSKATVAANNFSIR